MRATHKVMLIRAIQESLRRSETEAWMGRRGQPGEELGFPAARAGQANFQGQERAWASWMEWSREKEGWERKSGRNPTFQSSVFSPEKPHLFLSLWTPVAPMSLCPVDGSGLASWVGLSVCR